MEELVKDGVRQLIEQYSNKEVNYLIGVAGLCYLCKENVIVFFTKEVISQTTV